MEPTFGGRARVGSEYIRTDARHRAYTRNRLARMLRMCRGDACAGQLAMSVPAKFAKSHPVKLKSHAEFVRDFGPLSDDQVSAMGSFGKVVLKRPIADECGPRRALKIARSHRGTSIGENLAVLEEVV